MIDSFVLEVSGETIGTLNANRMTLSSGNYTYSLVHDSSMLYLSVDVSEEADETWDIILRDNVGTVSHVHALSDITLGGDRYRKATIRKTGFMQNVVLHGDGIIAVKGGTVTSLTQESGTTINIEINSGNDAEVTGTNEYGAFSYSDGVARNFALYNNTITTVSAGGVFDGGHVNGATLNIESGGTITGIVRGNVTYGSEDSGCAKINVIGGRAENATIDLTSDNDGDTLSFVGSVIKDSNLNCFITSITGCDIQDSVIAVSGSVSIEGGSLGNVTFTRIKELGNWNNLKIADAALTGDIVLQTAMTDYYYDKRSLDAAGHNIILDLREWTVNDGAMISLDHVSEDAGLVLRLNQDQEIGTYTIANGCPSLIDSFVLEVSGETVGTLNANRMTLSNGNYSYSLVHDSSMLYLSVDVSEEADETWDIILWDNKGTVSHVHALSDITLGRDNYQKATIRKTGLMQNVALHGDGTITVKGGTVSGLTQESGTTINIEINSGNDAEVTGTNEYGAFSYSDGVARNFALYNNTITTVSAGGVFDGGHVNGATLNIESGGTITGTVQGNVTNRGCAKINVNGGSVKDATIDLTSNNDGDTLSFAESTISNADLNCFITSITDCNIQDSVIAVSGSVSIEGGSLGNVTFTRIKELGNWNNLKIADAALTGDIVLQTAMTDYYYDKRSLDAAGHNIILDLREWTVNDEAMIDSSHIYNADLSVTLNETPVIGRYQIGCHSSKIGQGDPKGVWNPDTNEWDFKGEVIGDMDGVIEVRDENGILLANCAVNGDTEYFGRYNYTVLVDGNGDMYLDVGWNTREGRTYAADGLDNDTKATAAALPASGTKYTIDSATDADWFLFTLDTPGRSSSYIGIEFKQWAGDLDLYLYDSAGNQLDYSKSVTDNERISLRGLAAGNYYVKVEGYEGNVNEYKLAYSLPEPVVLTDEYELGNTPFSAVPLWTVSGTKTVHAAIQTADDVDYFSFVLKRKGTTADSVTLTFDPEFGDLDLYLFDVNGIFQLGKSISTDSGTETISLAGLKNGIYVAKVVSKDGITVANYDLSFTVREKEVAPDKYENNNTMRRATKLYTPNGEGSIANLSIHEDDVDCFSFSIKETGSADDWIGISYEVSMGDLDLEILNADGDVIAYSRTAENEDTVSLKGFAVGDYYIRVSGYNNVANNYTLNWNVTNSSLIPSDSYEGMEPIAIRENQTISGLSIAKPGKDDETRADTFRITLDYTGWKRSKIILTDYRGDWEDGMSYMLKDSNDNVLQSGTDSEISLAGLAAGDYYLTVDAPNEDEYSEYSVIAQCLLDSDVAKNNTWSIFVYMAADNNLEDCYLTELLYMQQAILPENVEVYVLMDRSDDYSVAERNWTDTRVGKIRHSNGGAVAVQWMYFDGINTDTYMNTHNLELRKEWDTGDVKTLEAFLDWGMSAGRADNYALIMCDHGSSLGYNSLDEDTGSIMAIEDIAELLKADKYKDLSVVTFEQCLMGSDVVVTAMEGTVEYVVASEAIGYGPNQSVMFKLLLNSLETDMTPQTLSQKIVAACNCSGLLDLTLASFHTVDSTLSEALQAFGEASRRFSRQDWTAICKSFARAYNYGDSICAFSDLGFFLSTLKEYSTTISGALMNATETLYGVLFDQVVDSTMITPAVYGSGLAVFNPVLSNIAMSFYSYGPGANLDYYGTVIGQSAWGEFLYTAGQLAEDCTEFFVDTRSNLTFTDFSYSIENEEVRVTYNLGTFTGNGVEYHGLYMDRKSSFTITLDQAGIEGDAIVVVADDPEANITVKLIQTEYPLFGDPIRTIRRTSTDGILSLEGIDPAKAGVDTEYDLIITSDKETTYSLSFVADWTSGSDFFDYTRSGRLGAQGNGSIDKATVLAAGNYGGLVTYAGDADYYKLNTVYTSTLDVMVNGSGLTVAEYDADGQWIQTAEWTDGKYMLSVANGNYLRVEGSADPNLTGNKVDSYSLYISDVAHTYLAPSGSEFLIPEKPVIEGDLKDNQVIVSVNVEDGMKGYSSDDLQTWTECENDSFVATQNGQYYFKSVNPETKLESKYTSLRVVGIDNVLPTVSNVRADVITPTNGNVIVTAEFADDVQLDVAQYRIDEGGKWLDYVDGVTVSENATVYFRAIDVAGNTSAIVPYDVTNIDKALPTVSNVQADITDPTKGSVTVTAVFADNIELKQSLYKIGEGGIWSDYVDGVTVTENTSVYFKAVDTAGNEAEEAYAVGNIDRDTPVIVVSGDNTTPLKASSLTATTEAGLDILYSTDGESWTKYEGEITVTANDTYYFMATDAAGNTGRAEYEFRNIDTTAPEITLSGDNQTPLQASTLIASVDDGSTIFYRIDDSDWQEYTGTITIIANGTYFFKATDAAGNEGTDSIVFANIIQSPVSEVAPQTQTWEKVAETTKYIVELSTDDGHAIQLVVDSNSLDSFQMPAGNYQMRVKPEDGEWTVLDPLVASEANKEPKLVKSNTDGNADVFFANPIGMWESGYVAQHVGSINDWSGTNEYASVCGKNKLADIIEGSTDANILLMTDDDNGDSLFVDDIYTTLPGSVTEQQSRIAQIDEIRAGAGDDIVDMTSQRFEYVGDGLTIRGGVGNDVIWANKGDNFLFGDAGNDRIVGASGNDVIAGGIGNDRMHGGGGSDIFAFGDSNWGEDTVEQLATGSVTLWFASGSMDNWDSASLTYRDGDNCVKVIGTTSIELRFGNDDSDMYKDLVSAGAFEEFTSERIFEESGKGILASL